MNNEKYVYSYQYRIYPTKKQVKIIESYQETLRRWWNKMRYLMLNQESDAWKELEDRMGDDFDGRNMKSINRYIKYLRSDNKYYAVMTNETIAGTTDRFKKSMDRFYKEIKKAQKKGEKYKGKGKPRFKDEDNLPSVLFRFQSKPTPYKLIKNRKGKFIRFSLPKAMGVDGIGDIKAVYHRDIPEEYEIRFGIIMKTKTNKWFITFQCVVDTLPDLSGRFLLQRAG